MIAGGVGGHASPGKAVLLRHAHALMTIGTGGLGDVAGENRRLGVEMRLDGVDAVAIGTYRGFPVPARDRFAMDALRVLLLHIAVALGAGARNIGFVDTRPGVIGRADLVAAVAIGADRGLGGTGGYRSAVHALL